MNLCIFSWSYLSSSSTTTTNLFFLSTGMFMSSFFVHMNDYAEDIETVVGNLRMTVLKLDITILQVHFDRAFIFHMLICL